MGKSVSSMDSCQKSAGKSMYSAGASMVFSNSGLSFFDHPVNRENRNVVVSLLQDLYLPITAIFLVARPINRENNGNFEHWAVKIQARGCLISIDFLENKGKGAFGLQQRTDAEAELDDFMYYAVVDPETRAKTRHKWEIISSVTPHPLSGKDQCNAKYWQYLSDHDRAKLDAYMRNARKHKGDPSKFLADIECERRVCDVAEFCRFFTADGKGYNAITKNCQQFAAELYAMLIGDNYREEAERVFRRYQGPYDKRQVKKGTNLSAQMSATWVSTLATASREGQRERWVRKVKKHSKDSKRKPAVDANSREHWSMQAQEDGENGKPSEVVKLFDDLNRSNSTESVEQ